MPSIPTPLRAALGLVANVIDEARTLPSKAVDLPVMVVSTALQVSLRAQQRYAELAMRGDEVLGRLHPPPEEPPSWATFDDEAVSAEAQPAVAEVAVTEAEPTPEPASAGPQPAEPASAEVQPAERVTPEAAPPPPTVSAEHAAADEHPATTAGRSTAAGRSTTAARSTAAARSATTKAGTKRTSKTVRAPRQAAPSPFDAADDAGDLPDGAGPATQLPAPGSTTED